MDEQAFARLEAKSVEGAIVERIQHDFNLAPFLARLHYQRMQEYMADYYDPPAEVGQISFLAVAADNPSGRPVAACRRQRVRLTLDSADDAEAWRTDLASMRRLRIQRLTEEAYEQGGLLTHEDLARLLCSSLATIKRDVAALRATGLTVPTRGQVKDMGKGVSHKAQIVADFLADYSFTDIQRRRYHSLASIERYVRDFSRVVRLSAKSLSVADIRRATGLSERLIQEYLTLYEAASPHSQTVQRLLAEPDPATETAATIKRGAWLR